jgi:hypothetical protein
MYTETPATISTPPAAPAPHQVQATEHQCPEKTRRDCDPGVLQNPIFAVRRADIAVVLMHPGQRAPLRGPHR